MVQNIKFQLTSFFTCHYYALFVHLDPFQKIEAKFNQAVNGKLHYQYTFALILFSICFFHGTFGLEFEYVGSVELANLPKSNYTMFHHITTPLLRLPVDMVMLGNTVVTALIFLVLICHNHFPSSVRIWPANYANNRHLIVGSKSILVESVSKKILKISQLGRLYVKFVTFGFGILIIYVYCYLHIFWVNAQFVSFTLNSMWVWLVEFPLYFDYVIHGNKLNKIMLKPVLTKILFSCFQFAHLCHDGSSVHASPPKGGSNAVDQTERKTQKQK